MKFSTTPIILATIAFSSPALTAPIDAAKSPNPAAAHSPAIARARMGSPAIREGSGSRHSIPVYRKRGPSTTPVVSGAPVPPPASVSTVTQGLAGLGFDVPAPVSDIDGMLNMILTHPDQIPKAVPNLFSSLTEDNDITPTIASVLSFAGSASSSLPTGVVATATGALKELPSSLTSALPVSALTPTVEKITQELEDLVDDDITPKLPSTAQMSASDATEAGHKRFEHRPMFLIPTLPESLADALSAPLSMVGSATKAAMTATAVASTVTAAPMAFVPVESAAAAAESIPAARVPAKHHFNPFQDSAPFSVVPEEAMRPGWIYADGLGAVEGPEGKFHEQSASLTSMMPAATSTSQ